MHSVRLGAPYIEIAGQISPATYYGLETKDILQQSKKILDFVRKKRTIRKLTYYRSLEAKELLALVYITEADLSNFYNVCGLLNMIRQISSNRLEKEKRMLERQFKKMNFIRNF